MGWFNYLADLYTGVFFGRDAEEKFKQFRNNAKNDWENAIEIMDCVHELEKQGRYEEAYQLQKEIRK